MPVFHSVLRSIQTLIIIRLFFFFFFSFLFSYAMFVMHGLWESVVTTCWSWAWSNRTSRSKWVGLGSPLAACSVYGDLTCSVHAVNNLCMFSCQCHFYLCNRGPYVRLAFVPNMLSSWNKDIIIIIIIIKKIISFFRSHGLLKIWAF